MNTRVWIPWLGFFGLNSWVSIPSIGFKGLDSWIWIPRFGSLGLGFLGLDSWVWSPGFGVLGLNSWIWTPGLNLRLEVIKPKIWSPELQILGFPPTPDQDPPGELGPETRFFLQALHKPARALPATSTW